MNCFFDCIQIKKNDVVAITGCHGKTSALFRLGREGKKRGTVLLTVSTKILVPENLEKDEKFFLKGAPPKGASLWVTGKEIRGEKLLGFSPGDVYNFSYYDFVFYEGDGSRGLPLKAWAKREPVILPETTKTLGILPFYALGMELSPKTVFQYDLFQERYGRETHFTEDLLFRILEDEKGLFKGARGTRIFFLNGCDDDEALSEAGELVEKIRTRLGIKCCYGSLRKEHFYD